MTKNIFTFNNFGYILKSFTDKELKPIKDEINEIKDNFNSSISFNNNLAGNLEKEYRLHKSFDCILNLFAPLIDEYEKTFNYLSGINFLKKDTSVVLDQPWVNFMKKNEFNPNHSHKGVFSFVLWIDIPYNIEDEINQASSKNSNSKVPGHFQFVYNNILGEIKTFPIPADKKFNGKGLLFPSKLTHAVYPFTTSDEYRISVSGNFILQN